MLDAKQTSLLTTGCPNDYSAADGILKGPVEIQSHIRNAWTHAIRLLDGLSASEILLIATRTYAKLQKSVGIPKPIRDGAAFKTGTQVTFVLPAITTNTVLAA